MNTPIHTCDECESEYYAHSSSMKTLCPDCAHYLYGHQNCKHLMQNGRCQKCYWNGKNSQFVMGIKQRTSKKE